MDASVFGAMKFLGEKVVEWHGRQQAIRTLLVAMYREAEHNLTLLNYLKLDDTTDNDVAGNDPAFLAVADVLSVEAHSGVLLALEDHGQSVFDAQTERRENDAERKRLLKELWVAALFIDEDGLPTIEDAAQDEDVAQRLSRLADRRSVGLLPAAAFVATRVRAMRSVVQLGERVSGIRKNNRGKVRLRTIRAYERLIARILRKELEQLTTHASRQLNAEP
jgi:hypothetical protein